ncbi:MAG TPA: iron-containing alcohol dehydrogenase [Verrucomicrobiales bacterium]|nr:iron-containing alcohol dehydrogenase [Verrucomicrobiales bacterium]
MEHAPCGRVIFGCGALEHSGEIARELGRRPLVVTDRGIRAVGIVDRAQRAMERAGLKVRIFDEVHENPTTVDVTQCVDAAREHGADLLVGLGGGSSMDAAKGCNFLLTNGGEMRDYLGREKATRPMLPLLAIPTTAGTGSECQSFALISDAETHQKMACGDKKAAARVALLDPELTLTQPPAVTAHTAVDAVSHAVESLVTLAGTEISRAYSIGAYRLLAAGLDGVWRDASDILARARLQLGAALAGIAIENSMLGAAHAAANPLTAHYGMVHGVAVGIMLPAVVRFNRDGSSEARDRYAQLRPERDLDLWLEEMLEQFAMPLSLDAEGVERERIAEMAREAAQQWTAQFNPAAAGEDEFAALYDEVWERREDRLRAAGS